MKIESKEVVTLTSEEKKMINDTYMLIAEIMEKTNDTKLYKITQDISNSMYEFGTIVDCETDK